MCIAANSFYSIIFIGFLGCLLTAHGIMVKSTDYRIKQAVNLGKLNNNL